MRWIVVLAALLGGCASLSPYDRMGSRPADASYRKLVLSSSSTAGSGSSVDVTLFIKAFDSGGKLGLCGYYLASGSGSDYIEMVGDQLSSADSVLSVDSEKVGDLSLLRWSASERDAVANCVQSKVAWKSSYSGGRIGISTPAVRRNG
jgi:hypothetical protein